MPYVIEESFWNKAKRKSIEQPLVPLGMMATCYALIRGVSAFRKGNQVVSQQMMRWRVGAQGFTILVALSSLYYYKQDNPNESLSK